MSTVIKAHATGHLLKRLSTMDLADHLAEARAVVEAAERRAVQIVAQAEERAKTILAEAKSSGYETGHKLGTAEGTKQGHQIAYEESVERFAREHANVVAAMRGAVDEFDSLKEDLMIAAQRDLLDFAVSLAGKLTFEIGRMHREAAIENLKRALHLVESRTNLVIYLHPDDVESVGTFAEEVLKRVDASLVFTIEADDSVAPGGCKVESDRTRVDATLETQVDETLSLLLGGNSHDA